MEERRYLQNYLKDRGLTIFFIVNAWDKIRDGIIDPEDTEALQVAEDKLRQVFQTNLTEYCQDRGRDIYQQRVFEISALNALRTRLKNPEATLEGTGFVEFLAAIIVLELSLTHSTIRLDCDSCVIQKLLGFIRDAKVN